MLAMVNGDIEVNLSLAHLQSNLDIINRTVLGNFDFSIVDLDTERTVLLIRNELMTRLLALQRRGDFGEFEIKVRHADGNVMPFRGDQFYREMFFVSLSIRWLFYDVQYAKLVIGHNEDHGFVYNFTEALGAYL